MSKDNFELADKHVKKIMEDLFMVIAKHGDIIKDRYPDMLSYVLINAVVKTLATMSMMREPVTILSVRTFFKDVIGHLNTLEEEGVRKMILEQKEKEVKH